MTSKEEKLVVRHVKSTKHENDLKDALGYGRASYFYQIAEVLENLGLDPGDTFSMSLSYGDKAFLVSNQPLNNEQLRAEIEPYIPEREEEENEEDEEDKAGSEST